MTSSDKPIKISKKRAEEFRGYMLEWYDKHARSIPWRAKKGEKSNPYHVWLSEIMCQQTTVQAVVPYFLKFIDKWPSVELLAAAEKEEIMREWAGLGYYARARNLHKCAGVIANDCGGAFPQNKDELEKLPGIGDYTSSAIATMAFNNPATVVDGNVERVMARYCDIREPLPKSKKLLKEAAALFFAGASRHGDFAQSLMDLGAMVCTPRSPKCMICPVQNNCKGREAGVAEALPAKLPKKKKPQKSGNVYWVENDDGEILLHTRADEDMMGGMIGLPTGGWFEGAHKSDHPKFLENVKSHKQHIRHSFTHFDLRLDLQNADMALNNNVPKGYFWRAKAEINPNEFPTLFKKTVVLYLS